MKITEKQYLKAKAIVAAYEEQLRKPTFNRKFKEEDLTILQSTIMVESLTENVVNDEFASALQNKIEEESDIPVRWVNLDDLGCIAVTFGLNSSVLIEQFHIDAVLSALNEI